MAQQFLGQIEAFAFNFPPKGWAFLRRSDTANQPEHGAVLAVGHHIRPQWHNDFRAAA